MKQFLQFNRFMVMLIAMLTLSLTSAWGVKYKLVTATSDLVAGSNYIIGSAKTGSAVFMATTENNNNRKESASASIAAADSTVTLASDMLVLQLGGSAEAWTLQTTNYAGTDGYLASAASGSNNYCRVISTSTTGTISFSDGAVVINLNPHTSRTLLRYNTSGLFACYSSGQSPVYLYKEIKSAAPEVSFGAKTIDFGNVDQNASVDAKKVKATLSNITGDATVSLKVGSAFSVSPLSLSESGDITITPVSTATLGEFKDTLILSAEGAANDTAVIVMNVVEPVVEEGVSFEQEASAYPDWTFKNFASKQSGSISAHKGTYYGTTDGKSTGYLTTKNKVNPDSIKFFVTKQSSNTTSSTWYIQVSTDSTNWTNVKSQSATSMDKGTWVEVKEDLSKYTNVYVSIKYDGSTAVRNIDDVILTTRELTKSVVSKDADIQNGDVSASTTDGAIIFGTTEVADGIIVTLSNTPAPDYAIDEYKVYKTGDVATTVTVTKGTFIMPAYAVTVSATFKQGIVAPTLSLAEGTYWGKQNVKISNYASDRNYYYTLDGTDPTATSTAYVDADGINVTASATLKVIAYKAALASDITSAAYVIRPIFNSLQELADATVTDKDSVWVNFTDELIDSFYVSSKGYTNGVYFHVQKAGKPIELFYNDVPDTWKVGGKLTGTMKCPFTLYYGTWEFAPGRGTWSWSNLTYTAPTDEPELVVNPTEVDFGEVALNEVVAAQEVNVTLVNLTAASATITGTAFSIDQTSLSASGKITITPSTDVAGEYSEILTVSAEGVQSVDVTVTMVVKASSALHDVKAASKVSKMVIDNRIVIIREGKRFSALGQEL